MATQPRPLRTDTAAVTRRQALWVAAAVMAAGVPAGGAAAAAARGGVATMPAKRRPTVVAFDVIETLFDLSPMGQRLKVSGLRPELLPVWFARLLRDATALDASGVFKPFPAVAASTLAVLMDEHGVEPTDDRVQGVLKGFAELPAHPDVRPAVQALRDAGVRAVTLTNGTAATTQALLRRAGLDGLVERTITVEEVGHWKPRPEVYRHAAKVCGVEPGRMALVAAHAWDTQGAGRAGLTTAWVARTEKRYAPAMDPPDVTGGTLGEVARGLLALG